MAELLLTITITPDEKLNDVIDAFCLNRGYTEKSGVTKQEFLKSELKEFIFLYYVQKKKDDYNTQTAEDLKQDLSTIEVSVT